MITLNINTLLKEELKKTNKANQINTQELTITDSLETLLEPHQNKCIINTKIGHPNEEKNKLSHRGQALRKLIEKLKNQF